MDLQAAQLGGSTEKTLWQICQLVVGDLPGEKQVWGIIQFTKSKIADRAKTYKIKSPDSADSVVNARE